MKVKVISLPYIFHVLYVVKISGERLQDQWSSGVTLSSTSMMQIILLLAHLSRRLIGELIVYPWSGVRPSYVVRRSQCSNIFSETQGSTLRGVLESETPSLPPRTPRFCRLGDGGLLESGGKKSSIKKSMQLMESLEKIFFPMRFTDKLNSVSHFCLQFEWTTCSAIFGVSC